MVMMMRGGLGGGDAAQNREDESESENCALDHGAPLDVDDPSAGALRQREEELNVGNGFRAMAVCAGL